LPIPASNGLVFFLPSSSDFRVLFLTIAGQAVQAISIGVVSRCTLC